MFCLFLAVMCLSLALGPREMGQEENTDQPKFLCIHQPLFSLPWSSQVWKGLFRSERIRQ